LPIAELSHVLFTFLLNVRTNHELLYHRFYLYTSRMANLS
jgi:hypothetical protein